MQVTILGKERPAWVAALCVIALTLLGYAHYLSFWNREVVILGAAAALAMLARGDLRRLWNLPSMLLLGYIGYTAVSACWAVSGKFFLNQFSKIFPAAVLFLALALYGRAEKGFLRQVTAAVADASAIVALLSVEAASTGLVHYIVYDLIYVEGIDTVFNGSRLYGIFGNSNVEAAIYAIGIVFSLSLLAEADGKRERTLRAATLAVNAFGFLLVFSMGAMACFAVALVVYLIAAGGERGRALVRMLCAAVPTAVFGFAASRFFNADGALKAVVLVLLLLDAAAVAALDRALTDRLGAVFAAREKTLYGVIFGVIALLALYLVLAMRLNAPYSFGGTLHRAVALAPGEHTLTLDASGEVATYVYSKDDVQVLTGGADALYSGTDTQLRFTVPERSAVVTFTFSADEGTVLRAATLDGETPLMLRYRLLPSFIANRLQGTLTSNSSVAVRVKLWRDGIRYWKLAPVFGHGMGAFETGLPMVQDFDYETKFPHNHYIQVMLEGGVVGFALFLASLIAFGAALWKRRRALREGQFAMLYAAFIAEFTMNALQMLWDIEMTNVVFLAEIHAFYAMLTLTCAEPLPGGVTAFAPASAPEDTQSAARQDGKEAKETAKKRKNLPAKPLVRPELRAAAMLIPAFVFVTFLGNLIARPLVTKPPEDSLAHYLRNLETAEKLDLYEHNDAQLNYALQVAQYENTEQYLPKANAYAEKLARLQSNSIHMYLTEYYVNTQQYVKATEMPLLAARYAASDESMWNDILNLLHQALTDPGIFSPLLADPQMAQEALPNLAAYYDAWRARCETALVPIRLDPENEAFFNEILALNAVRGDASEMAKLLSAPQA